MASAEDRATVRAALPRAFGPFLSRFPSLTAIQANGKTIWDGAFKGGVSGVTWNGEDANYIKFNVEPGTWTVCGKGTLPLASPKKPATPAARIV